MVILLNGWILPIGGASLVEGLPSTGLPRLVRYYYLKFFFLKTQYPKLLTVKIYPIHERKCLNSLITKWRLKSQSLLVFGYYWNNMKQNTLLNKEKDFITCICYFLGFFKNQFKTQCNIFNLLKDDKLYLKETSLEKSCFFVLKDLNRPIYTQKINLGAS